MNRHVDVIEDRLAKRAPTRGEGGALKELEQAAESKIVKAFFRWFAYITIVLVPLAIYCIVTALLVEKSQYLYYYFHDRPAKF